MFYAAEVNLKTQKYVFSLIYKKQVCISYNNYFNMGNNEIWSDVW